MIFRRNKFNKKMINFNYESYNKEKCSFSIVCDSNNIRCERIINPLSPGSGEVSRKKAVVEKLVSLDDKGYIFIQTNGATAYNTEKYSVSNNYSWSEKKEYNDFGIMMRNEYIGYENNLIDSSIDTISSASMLYSPRVGDYKRRQECLMSREKMDVAWVNYKDFSKGIQYRSFVPLNQEHGLRNMKLPNDLVPSNKEIVINNLSSDEIEVIIKKENNPKVEEGLRRLAVGRENFYYNNMSDPNYVCDGIEKGITK